MENNTQQTEEMNKPQEVVSEKTEKENNAETTSPEAKGNGENSQESEYVKLQAELAAQKINI